MITGRKVYRSKDEVAYIGEKNLCYRCLQPEYPGVRCDEEKYKKAAYTPDGFKKKVADWKVSKITRALMKHKEYTKAKANQHESQYFIKFAPRHESPPAIPRTSTGSPPTRAWSPSAATARFMSSSPSTLSSCEKKDHPRELSGWI
ncbi:hypothetical protein BJ878DRAFT_570108 [Calycina marina]|uniref:Uncharacterized protein n=1 Tax=Calycina marina TaxID=1763456 RepID=A0A9P8CC27_9HELO|nr:hypothetical protein BJ878DRAFT_570108 [Calycina marina]